SVRAAAWSFSLVVNVLVVFASVFWRYALNQPLDWVEEVASALMVTIVFCGAATCMSHSRHIGVDLFLAWLPGRVRTYVAHGSRWILLIVSFVLLLCSFY